MPRRLVALAARPDAARSAPCPVVDRVAATGSRAAALVGPRRSSRPIRPGDTGWRVRELQSRLHQLGLHSEVVTNRFDAETRAGVATFQRRRGWTPTAWSTSAPGPSSSASPPSRPPRRCTTSTRPAARCSSAATRGMWVRQVQARLKQVRWYDAKVTGRYTGTTVDGGRGLPGQAQDPRHRPGRPAHPHPAQGDDPASPRRPSSSTSCPQGPALDPRCTTGRAMCVDKTSRSLRWVVDGVVLRTVEVRFGSDELPTREGAFAVFRKSRDHVSSLYDTPMPFAMFFSGGQAVHYSPDFAANGYNGASHGCVNVRDRAAVAWLFDQVQARRQGDRLPLLSRAGRALGAGEREGRVQVGAGAAAARQRHRGRHCDRRRCGHRHHRVLARRARA